MHHLIHDDTTIAAGTTQLFIPCVCIHRIHRFAMLASSVPSLSVARCENQPAFTGNGSMRELKLKCLSKSWRFGKAGDGRLKFRTTGDVPREEEGLCGGVRSQRWLSEFSSRCLRGVGATICGGSDTPDGGGDSGETAGGWKCCLASLERIELVRSLGRNLVPSSRSGKPSMMRRHSQEKCEFMYYSRTRAAVNYSEPSSTVSPLSENLTFCWEQELSGSSRAEGRLIDLQDVMMIYQYTLYDLRVRKVSADCRNLNQR